MDIFLDCGTHKGEGLTEFLNLNIIGDGYKVYCFEPNPNLTDESKLSDITLNDGKRVGDLVDIIFSEKAVWIEDGFVEFVPLGDHASHIMHMGHTNQEIHTNKEKPVGVPSFDLSKFIDSLPYGSNITCKMDIEGAEFKVLRKLIEDGTIKRIKRIYVEFHPHFVIDESDDSTNKIINTIIGSGVEYHSWY